jgi:hypothetical protein
MRCELSAERVMGRDCRKLKSDARTRVAGWWSRSGKQGLTNSKQQGRTQPPARSSNASRVGWWHYETLLWTIKTSSQLSLYNIFPQRPLSPCPRCTDKGWGDLRPACPPTLTPRIFPANDRNFKAHKLKYWLAVSCGWRLASDLGVRACRACVCLKDLVVGKLTETSLSSETPTFSGHGVDVTRSRRVSPLALSREKARASAGALTPSMAMV